MDLFFSPLFIKYEVAFLLLNFAYIVFHLLHSLVHSYLKVRAFVGKKKTAEEIIEAQNEAIQEEEQATETIQEEKKEEKEEEKEATASLSGDEKQYLGELIKNIKTRIAR